MPGRSDGTDDGHSGMGGADGGSSGGGRRGLAGVLAVEFLVAYEKGLGGGVELGVTGGGLERACVGVMG